MLECRNQVLGKTFPDLKGDFSIMVSLSDAGSAMTAPRQQPGKISNLDWPTCELYREAPGFLSERVRMTGNASRGIVQVGTILLHSVSPPRASAVSVISLAAPDKAKKAFDKGREQEQKGRWAAACDYFKRAIADYPRYALAWLELGRSQIKQNSFTEAQQSLQQAVSQDPKFMDGYVELARLAAQQQNWKELADYTERVVDFSPDSSPEFWFMNSAANYNLGDVKRAETSVQRGLRMDAKHQFPQLEYLYGLILARKGDFKSAIEHVSAYLQLSPNAKDGASAQETLAGLQKQVQLAER